MSKTAFITGATSGIGEATARLFAENNINLVLCGRNQEKLSTLEKELSTKVKVTTLNFDVTDREGVFSAVNSLSDEWRQKLNILINNAGNAYGLELFEEGSLDDFDKMIETNITGFINVAKAIVPIIKNNKNAHVVNLSSIAGKEVYPKGGVYCATKHAVESLSQTMRMELNSYGVKVSNIAPGAVNTNFSTIRFAGDSSKADAVYSGYTPLVAEDIADNIYYCISRPDHVQIADLVVYPTAQASGTIFNKKK